MKRPLNFICTIIILTSIFAFSPHIYPANNSHKLSIKDPELEWHTDLTEAMTFSKQENKPIFAFFTGSDWCGWCKKLQRNVFAKEKFKIWANDNVILLELDFPRKTKLTPELAQQNASLAQAFKVRGYPTIWLFYAEQGEESQNINLNALGSLGYPSGAAAGKEEELFIKNANLILAKDTQ